MNAEAKGQTGESAHLDQQVDELDNTAINKLLPDSCMKCGIILV